jgi:hypothetical protein
MIRAPLEAQLRNHLSCAHGKVFQQLCPIQHALHQKSIAGWNMSWYVYAIRILERERVPAHGLSIERRTMQIVNAAFNDELIKALVCLCCGQIYTSWIGSRVVTTHPEKEKSAIVMVRGDWLIDFCIGTDDSRQFNFEAMFFKENYVSKYSGMQKDPYLKDDSWEWR